jgi:hypothetical protein
MRFRAGGFVLVGIGTALVYGAWALWVPLLPTNLYAPLLDLGKITGYTWASTWRFCLIVGTLFASYVLGWRLVLRERVGLRPVLTFAAIFCVVLLFAYPATAADVFGYVAQGRLLALHGANPFAVAPAAYPGDAVVGYLAFPREPTQYGPLWAWLGAAISRLAGSGPATLGAAFAREILLYKAVAACAQLGGGALVHRLALALGATPGRAVAAAYLYAWNPLLLWEMVGNAHNDGVMVLGALAACLALAMRRNVLVLPALALGALIKVPVAALAPLLGIVLLRRDRRAALAGLALSAALLAAAYAPFWVGVDTLTFLGRGDLFTASLASCVMYALQPRVGQATAMEIARGATRALLVVALVPICWRAVLARSDREVVGLGYALMLVVLVLGVTWFQAWYLVWPIALALPLADRHRDLEVVLLSLGGMATYLVFIYLWVMAVLPPQNLAVIQLAAYCALVGPVVIGAAVARAASTRPTRAWSPTWLAR